MAGGTKNFQRNFRGSTDSFRFENAKGTKPTSQPTSVKEVIMKMIIYGCKKSIFYDIRIKVGIYLAAIFLISIIADFIPFPKTYFSRSDNLFNQYFVKIGWFWTLALTIPFSFMTSYSLCCGKEDKVIKGHLTRLAIATFFWYFWTSFFNYVESSFGKCNYKSYTDKPTCLKNGWFWNGFDISGHCFILIYSSLILIEEAKAIIGWDYIKDYIRDEEYCRSINDKNIRTNPLRSLEANELKTLKESYTKYTPYVRWLFIAMTLLQVLWDVMLVCTLMYYHVMAEKFVSGIVAILTWYSTYLFWYKIPNCFPLSPGDGLFKHNKNKPSAAPAGLNRKRSSLNGKHFMGNPLYSNYTATEGGEGNLEGPTIR